MNSSGCEYETRRYPWGIQRIVSTYSNYSGGGVLEGKTQSAKICLILHFQLGGVLEGKTQNAKICLILNFQLGGVLEVKTQSAKICPNFNFRGLGVGVVLDQISEQGVVSNGQIFLEA